MTDLSFLLDFRNDRAVKALSRKAGPAGLMVFLEMSALASRTEYTLHHEDSWRTFAMQIALDLDYDSLEEEEGLVTTVIETGIREGLIESRDGDESLFFSWAEKISTSESARKKRAYREKKKDAERTVSIVGGTASRTLSSDAPGLEPELPARQQRRENDNSSRDSGITSVEPVRSSEGQSRGHVADTTRTDRGHGGDMGGHSEDTTRTPGGHGEDTPGTSRGQCTDMSSQCPSLSMLSMDKGQSVLKEEVLKTSSFIPTDRQETGDYVPVSDGSVGFKGLPLSDGGMWIPTREEMDDLVSAFPGVDVPAQLERMRVWIRTTREGCFRSGDILRTVYNWMGRNACRTAPARARASSQAEGFRNLFEEISKEEEAAQ